jgi:hypothetical protein
MKNGKSNEGNNNRGISDAAQRTAEEQRNAGRETYITRSRRETQALAAKFSSGGRDVIVVGRHGKKRFGVSGQNPDKSWSKSGGYVYSGEVPSGTGYTGSGLGSAGNSGGTHTRALRPFARPSSVTRTVLQPDGNGGFVEEEVTIHGVEYVPPTLNQNLVSRPGWMLRTPGHTDVGIWSETYGEEGFFIFPSISQIEGPRQYIADLGYTWRLGATPLQQQWEGRYDGGNYNPWNTGWFRENFPFLNRDAPRDNSPRPSFSEMLPPGANPSTIPRSAWD